MSFLAGCASVAGTMKTLISVDESPAAWLVEWLRKPSFAQIRHSIVIGARCGANLQRIGTHVAEYLNENDPEARNHWHPFCLEDLRHFAGDPAYRDLILAGQTPDHHSGPPDSDIDRIARRLARLGGAVLEGQYSLDATNDLDNAFRICLCSHDPVCIAPCHMWLNPQRFSRSSLISVIADSFLDWTSRNPTTLAFHPAS